MKRFQKLLCQVLGHDPIVVWPVVHCRRCVRTWRSG